MSINPKYPGVYIQELPPSSRAIIGVSTSITAFIGGALKGPTDKATMIHSYGDFTRIFGGLWKHSNMSYAVYQYYQNGGTDAVIVRVALKTPSRCKFTSTNTQLTLEASSPGKWAENLQVAVSEADPDKLGEDPTYFNMAVQHKSSDPNKEGHIRKSSLMFRLTRTAPATSAN